MRNVHRYQYIKLSFSREARTSTYKIINWKNQSTIQPPWMEFLGTWGAKINNIRWSDRSFVDSNYESLGLPLFALTRYAIHDESLSQALVSLNGNCSAFSLTMHWWHITQTIVGLAESASLPLRCKQASRWRKIIWHCQMLQQFFSCLNELYFGNVLPSYHWPLFGTIQPGLNSLDPTYVSLPWC